MKTRVDYLRTNYNELTTTVTGDFLFQSLVGFADILDNSTKGQPIDNDLVDIYMVLGLKNGSTIQLTGQIVDIWISDDCMNIVRIQTEDRKTWTMPNSTYIFSLNDIVSLQSLDIVSHQKKIDAKFAAEEQKRKAAAETELKAEVAV